MRDALGDVQSVLVFGGGSDIALATVRRLVGRRARTIVLAAHHPDALDGARAELLAAALEYVGLGLEVFPLSYVKADGTCSAYKRHCKCQGDPGHAGKCQVLDHWDAEASADPDKISTWWGPRSGEDEPGEW